ncbi:DedA family protein [Massilia soli]|uniref:DedA family protein n=1 Tax=Massilia soli TaxID=2792854 RepID=A0ABS7SPS0_9BURK|nr:DedA family protein [Massilia soli]MBZ2207946.1 DedA family protein [Massilia soli]
MFEFITDFLGSAGYLGVFLLMALENIFPPIPSEMIMPFAGFIVARGDLGLVGVLLAGTAGSVLGTLPWFYAGKAFGHARLRQMAARWGHWMTVTPEEIDKSLATFDRHGVKAVLFGRLIPAIRTLISIPAGIAKMRVLPFLAWSTVGSLAWCSILTGAGFVLEANYEAVATYVDPVSKVVLGILVATYLYRLVTFRAEPKSRAE